MSQFDNFNLSLSHFHYKFNKLFFYRRNKTFSFHLYIMSVRHDDGSNTSIHNDYDVWLIAIEGRRIHGND